MPRPTGFFSEKVIDGDGLPTDAPVPGGQCLHDTGNEGNGASAPAWWGVDLFEVRKLARIKIYPRDWLDWCYGGCPERNRGLDIYLGEDWTA